MNLLRQVPLAGDVFIVSYTQSDKALVFDVETAIKVPECISTYLRIFLTYL